eukprot:m.361709 g.361709  ORF g.361709 m.361709 type:complete len:60 (-) comp19832_c0_seq1:4-183(-)
MLSRHVTKIHTNALAHACTMACVLAQVQWRVVAFTATHQMMLSAKNCSAPLAIHKNGTP